MKIAIIGAMAEEVELLRVLICPKDSDAENVLIFGGCNFYYGSYSDHEIILVQSGIGKVAAATSTAILLQQFKPDIVLNTGSAGGLHPSLHVGDIVISTHTTFHDVDVTAFGYAYGQMAQMPELFHSNPQLVELAELAIPSEIHNEFQNAKMLKGLICSGDTFVHTKEQQHHIKSHFPNVIAVEMEAAAIAQVCHQFMTPFVVIRAISDVADQAATLSFDEFLPLAAQRSSLIVSLIIKQINGNLVL